MSKEEHLCFMRKLPRFRLCALYHMLKLSIVEDDFDICAEIDETVEGWNEASVKKIKKDLMRIPPIIMEVFKKHFPELTLDSERDKEIEIRDYMDHCYFLWFMDKRPFSNLAEDKKIKKATEIMTDIAEAVIAALKEGDK